jgi:hypothetical protein
MLITLVESSEDANHMRKELEIPAGLATARVEFSVWELHSDQSRKHQRHLHNLTHVAPSLFLGYLGHGPTRSLVFFAQVPEQRRAAGTLHFMRFARLLT